MSVGSINNQSSQQFFIPISVDTQSEATNTTLETFAKLVISYGAMELSPLLSSGFKHSGLEKKSKQFLDNPNGYISKLKDSKTGKYLNEYWNVDFSKPVDSLTNIIGLDFRDKTSALAIGFLGAELLGNKFFHPTTSAKSNADDPFKLLIDLTLKFSSAVWLMGLASKKFNNHFTRFLGLAAGFGLGELLIRAQDTIEDKIRDTLYNVFPALKPTDKNSDNWSLGSALSQAISLKVLFFLKFLFLFLPFKTLRIWKHLHGEMRLISNNRIAAGNNLAVAKLKTWGIPLKGKPNFDKGAFPLENINSLAEWLKEIRELPDLNLESKPLKLTVKAFLDLQRLIAKYIIGSPHWLKELKKDNKATISQLPSILKDHGSAIGLKIAILTAFLPLTVTASFISYLMKPLFENLNSFFKSLFKKPTS